MVSLTRGPIYSFFSALLFAGLTLALPTLISRLMFKPFQSAAMASSIQGHSVTPTFSRTKTSRVCAPGASAKIASAPTRGMWSIDARRGSVTVARGISRVACGKDEDLSVDRWTSVGR
jgi:hypothetical protein